MFPEVWALPPKPKMVTATVLFSSNDLHGIVEDDLGRMRFRGYFAEVYAATPRLARGWMFYRHMLSKRDDTRKLIKQYNLDAYFKCDNWKEMLGWLSDTQKKGDLPERKYLIDLATLGGYEPLLSDDEVLEQAMDWFGTTKTKGSYPTYLDDFRCAVVEFIEEASFERRVEQPITLQEYADNPILWGTAGSVLYTKRVRVDAAFDGRIIHADKTKWGAALLVPPAVVVQSVLAKRAQYAKVVQKRETKKSRLIVSTDLEDHWRMDFVSKSGLDHLFTGSKLSTIWMSSAQQRSFWLHTADFSDGSVRMPLDQSKFDQEQTRKMVKIVLEELANLLERKDASPETIFVARNLVYCLTHGYVEVNGKKVPYRNGVLSGWRWTAMLDTIINGATFIAASRRVLADQYHMVKEITSQGDDLATRFDNYLAAAAVWHAISQDGFIVNPNKFFLSRCKDEYLRKIMTPGKVDGYPARIVNALLWRNPVNKPPEPGKLRMSEMLSQYHTLVNRMEFTWDDILPTMLDDIAGANDMTRCDVYDWLATPASLGGGGLVLPYLGRWVAAEQSTVEQDTPRIISSASGLQSVIKQASVMTDGAIGPRAVKQWADGVVSYPSRKFTYTRAGVIRVQPPVYKLSIRNTHTVLPPPVVGLAASYWSMDPPALGATHRDYLPNCTDNIRAQIMLRQLKLPAPRVPGVAYSFATGYVNSKFMNQSVSQLIGFREANVNAWDTVRYYYEEWFAKAMWDGFKFTSPGGAVQIAD